MQDLVDAVLSHGGHALAGGDILDFLGGGALVDERLDFGGDVEELEDADASFVAGVVAEFASASAVEGSSGEEFAGDAEESEFVVGGFVGLHAVFADSADESLCEDACECGGDEEGFDAHVDESCDGAGGVVGVEGREDHVSGEGGLDGHAGGFGVSDFADHDAVGVLTEEGSECGGEGESDFGGDMDLLTDASDGKTTFLFFIPANR